MTKALIAAALAAIALTATIAASALAAPQAQRIQVTERDYRIALSARPTAGRVTFVVRNTGEDAHDFIVRGGGKTFRTRMIAPGGTARVTATLKRGVRYQFWCSVGSHAKKGMRGSFVAR